MSTPSVGRIVHYVSQGSPYLQDGSQVYPSVCRAAIVTELDAHPEENHPGEVFAAVAVLNPTGMHFHAACLQDEDEKTPGSWHWPERV